MAHRHQDRYDPTGPGRPTTVRLSGPLDMTTVPSLRTRLLRLPVGADLELDLSQVQFLGAAGLHLLRQLRQQRARTGAALCLTGVPHALHQILTLVGLRDLMAERPNIGDGLIPALDLTTIWVDTPPPAPSPPGRHHPPPPPAPDTDLRLGRDWRTPTLRRQSMTGEHTVIDTFVELADTMTDEFDVSEFLHMLIRRCVELLEVDAAGLVLADTRGVLRVLAASTEQVRVLEVVQLQNEEGPCSAAFTTGCPVSHPDLATAGDRWPRFAVAATEAGFASVHALPMRLRSEVIGALTLLRTDCGSMSDTTLATARALVAMATIGLLQERAIRDREIRAMQLQTALNSRVVIEQAKGLLAERLGVDMDAAFTVLRTYARNHSLKLRDVANTVITAGPSVYSLLDTSTLPTSVIR